MFGLVLALFASSLLLAAACVVPPPLDIDNTDAGANSPPVITQARDSAATSLRPPATLTVNTAAQPPADIDLTMYDPDADDDLTIQLFVNYDPLAPLPARVKCSAPPADDGSRTRSRTCTTAGLCTEVPLGVAQRLEIEVYDRAPDDVTPYRQPGAGGFFSLWTLDLICTNTP